MIHVNKPQNVAELNMLLHDLLALVRVLPDQMMMIDMGRPEHEIGSPFGDCDGSRLIEMLVISGRAALELGNTEELKLILCKFVADHEAELTAIMQQPIVEPQPLLFKKNSNKVH